MLAEQLWVCLVAWASLAWLATGSLGGFGLVTAMQVGSVWLIVLR